MTGTLIFKMKIVVKGQREAENTMSGNFKFLDIYNRHISGIFDFLRIFDDWKE